MAKFLSVSEAAAKHGTTAEYLRRLCREGRVNGAQQVGRAWLIPAAFVYERRRAGRKAKSN